jgi:hypothetical protein
MHHADYSFLLARAKLVEGYAERARLQGEEYHPCVRFTPLSTGGHARMLIVDGRLRLKVKGCDGEAEAKSIFGDAFEVDGDEYVGAVPTKTFFTG